MKKSILIIGLFLVTVSAMSQRDALYSQFMFNRLVINPGYTGSRDMLTMTLLNRYQWVGFGDGAPKTLTFSAHSPLRNENVALGMYVYADQTGPFTDVGFMGNYAYRVRLFKGILSLGLQAGFNQVNVDWDALEMRDGDDEVILNRPKNKLQPDANFGIYYYTRSYYLGVSSKQLFESQYGKVEFENGLTSYATLARHFYGIAGLALPLSDNIVFRPGMMFKYTANAPLNMDLNASFLFNDVLWVGASYRTNKNAITSKNAIVFMVELNLTDNWRLGYSYDAYLTEMKTHTQGSHEVMISYDMNLFKPRLLTPRYF
ncbi:type IX secretion system membrane protein PorP/SprF [Lentimicrobium sp.]|jgi:type IX secretion system PorP/SprF family membrane protein|uniref:PorP/SprF family type IX secretion system membrane protein n=1 Tax=Lentimicrobium sp. TaxID=2034841 RepID=UPI002BB2E42F|nr:type IX secretion system membrane protein PorP/SprF [Lentimicrobium sp.]MCO5261326.1 type IX secretion system membrane protein PorP/SprF [Lentimicrobium sp.]HPJ63363.1 type IX secretion system membrane protein PorP/SprF [Lentimicrobium sp.]HPR24779.1 type IX secretion system membrane protein PorP/SprF [Lentimicrobium sp.]